MIRVKMASHRENESENGRFCVVAALRDHKEKQSPTRVLALYFNQTIRLLHVEFCNDQIWTGELNTRGVAKYSDFGHINGYISETVQDMT